MSQPLPDKVPDELINNKSIQVRNYFQTLTKGAYYLWEQVKNLSGSGNVSLLNTVKDLTSATSDYSLSVNETAKIDITAASTALNIAVSDGVYEMNMVFDESTFASDGQVIFQPNNQDHAGEFFYVGERFSDAIATDELDVSDGGAARDNIFFAFSATTPRAMRAKITILGTRSSCFSELFGTQSGNPADQAVKTSWVATAWTSLGTLVLPEDATGICYVKRIA